jgi:hypothetical protein
MIGLGLLVKHLFLIQLCYYYYVCATLFVTGICLTALLLWWVHHQKCSDGAFVDLENYPNYLSVKRVNHYYEKMTVSIHKQRKHHKLFFWLVF